MKRIFSIIAVSALALILFSGCQNAAPADSGDAQSKETAKNTKVSIEIKDGTAEGAMPDTNGTEVVSATTGIITDPVFQDFDTMEYDIFKGNKPFALFFRTDGCAECKMMEADIVAELDNFPPGTVIFNTDAEAQPELAKELNITFEPSVVVFDAAGAVIYTAESPLTEDVRAAIVRSMMP